MRTRAKGIGQQRFLVPVLVGLATFAACVTTPDSGRKQLNLLPESQMNAMGKEAYEDIKRQERISPNKALAAKVTEVGRRIAQASGRNYDWEFNLFASDQVNAFCLPGGKIGVYEGLIPVAENNAALAAVMGHEVAHATARHSNERVSQSLLAAGGLMIAGEVLKDNRYRNEILAALGVGVTFGVILPYSRNHEAEADMIGAKFMAKAGYDPREAIELWKRMAKAGGGTPPEFLSTHPDPLRRAKALEALLPEIMPIYEASSRQKTEKLL